MTNWRDMTIEQRKQHKYEMRQVRKMFERAARLSVKGGHTSRRRRNSRGYGSRHYKLQPSDQIDHQHNGRREMDRRKRQIERGSLKVANGLRY